MDQQTRPAIAGPGAARPPPGLVIRATVDRRRNTQKVGGS
jgi:hypothetical protein